MNIAFDVDGVLTDIHAFQIKYGQKYFKRPPDFFAGYDVTETFQCSISNKKRFWTRYMWKYCVKEQPRLDAARFMQMLKDEGHTIYIITSRAFCAKRNIMGMFFRRVLKNWLHRHGFPYDGVYFCREDAVAEDKLYYCKLLNIQTMFEDNAENLLSIMKQVRPICFDAIYNKQLTELTRINNFTDLIRDGKAIMP